MFVLAFFMCAIGAQAATHIINVSSQEDFDNLNERILSLLGDVRKTKIKVVFSYGIYSFHEDHINLKNIDAPLVELSFEGNGSIIMSEGGDYANGDNFSDDVTPIESFVTTDGKDLNTWSKMLRTSNYLVEVVDKSNMLCRLNVSDLGYLSDKSEEDCRWIYIWIPQWFKGTIYKVNKIQSGYIYFFASSSDLINGDYSYGKVSQQRFKLSNNPDERGDILICNEHIYMPEGIGNIRHAKATRVINSFNNNFKSISIRGLRFYGNGKQYNNNNELPENNKQLIDLRCTDCSSVSIKNCEFKSLQVGAVNVTSTNNVFIEDCCFEDCYSFCIYQERSSRVININNCTFHNVNKRMTNSKAIQCRGCDFHVYDNIISDFAYCAISAGNWYGHPDVTLNCNGIIERNEMFYTQPYFEKADEHNNMDSGAIYLYTVTNSTIVRYNHIHHYGGARGNRGIFCDDGAFNFQIYGNTITNIGNNDWSIAARRETSLDSKFGGVNINNIIRDNIVDGPILFEGNEKSNNGCIFEGNIHLDGNNSNDKISNVNQ